jgi:hypothetical protein
MYAYLPTTFGCGFSGPGTSDQTGAGKEVKAGEEIETAARGGAVGRVVLGAGFAALTIFTAFFLSLMLPALAAG